MDSWVENDKEDTVFDAEKRLLRFVPRIVYVQFYSSVWDEKKRCNIEKVCQWVIPGVNRPGIYPVFPWKRSWHLDQHRRVPRLEVKRFQIPLAPAYAMTAHASQGRTLAAAIIDLQLGRGKEIPARRMVCRTCDEKELMAKCSICNEVKLLQKFTPKMRKENALKRKCMVCQDSLICSGCKNVRRFTSFAKSERSKADGTWLCPTCMTKKCSNCLKLKPKFFFVRPMEFAFCKAAL